MWVCQPASPWPRELLGIEAISIVFTRSLAFLGMSEGAATSQESLFAQMAGDLGGRDGEGLAFLVDVQSDEVNDFAHGCSVPFNWFIIAAEHIGLDPTGG